MGGLKVTNNTLKSVGLFDKIGSSGSGGAISNATLAEQQAQTTLLNQILNEADYEHTVIYGRDSRVLTEILVDNESSTQYQNNPPAETPPLTTATPTATFSVTNSGNNDFYVDVDLTGVDISPTVDINITVEILSCTPNTGVVTLEFYGDSINLLATANIFTTGSSGSTLEYNFTYDNSITAYSLLSLRIYQSDTSGDISVNYYDISNNVEVDLSDLETAIVKKVEFYQNNVLVGTSYFDIMGNAYSLVGEFIPDDRIQSTYLEQLILAELQKITGANLPSHAELSNPNSVTYTGFKSISFICDGTIDVILDGNIITYPYTLGSQTILGSTIEADEASLNSIEFDGTGTVLLTIKK